MRFFLPLSIAMISAASAEFEKWTDKSGRTAEMELQSVSKNGDVNVGKFLLKNGTAVTLDDSKLSEADAKRLTAWKPEKPGAAVFDDVDGYGSKGRGGPVDQDDKDDRTPFDLYSKLHFHLKTPFYCGIKQDSLAMISSNLSDSTKILKLKEAENLDAIEKEKNMKFWQIGAPDTVSRCGDFYGTVSNNFSDQSKKPGIHFEIQFRNDEPIPQETLEKASFKGEIIAVRAEGLKDGEITIAKADLADPARSDSKSKETIKTFGVFGFSLMQFDLLSGNHQDTDLNLTIHSPYSPSGIESPQLFSEGKPITKLSEVTGSEIKVKFKYWTGIKEVKVLCEKTPESKSSQPDPDIPEAESQ